MNKETITATKAFTLLIQATADITDKREEAEKLGFIEKSMTDTQAIGTLLAQYILIGDYEYEISPQIMFSLIKNYCHEEILEWFKESYYIITKYNNIKQIPLSQFESQQFDVSMDIKGAAEQGSLLGWQISWCPFKEPYKTRWLNSFKTLEGDNMNSQYDDIAKLAELKEKGLISEEEFQKQKGKILNQDLSANNQPVKRPNSFTFKAVVFFVLGLIVPFWPISLPIFWYLAYKSYKSGE